MRISRKVIVVAGLVGLHLSLVGGAVYLGSYAPGDFVGEVAGASACQRDSIANSLDANVPLDRWTLANKWAGCARSGGQSIAVAARPQPQNEETRRALAEQRVAMADFAQRR